MPDTLHCPFCQAAIPFAAQYAGSRTVRAGDVLICLECLAPSLIRRAKGRTGPRLSAPPAPMLIGLRRHPQVRAIIDAIQRGDRPPATRVSLQTLSGPPDDERSEHEMRIPRPPIADRPPARWDVRVGVWMDLKKDGMPMAAVAAKYGTTLEFVESVDRDGLFPSYFRIVRDGDRVTVDDGSGTFVTWTTPQLPDAPMRDAPVRASGLPSPSARHDAIPA